jgi:hypothetical protein
MEAWLKFLILSVTVPTGLRIGKLVFTAINKMEWMFAAVMPAGQLLALADTVQNHVRYEEREMFPHLEKVLTDEQLKKIGKQITRQHDQLLKDDFTDEFLVEVKKI